VNLKVLISTIAATYFLSIVYCSNSMAESEPIRRMPEPLISESLTDIDGLESGELEFDATVNTLRSTDLKSGGNGQAIEAEWRATDRLGLGAEASYTSDNQSGLNIGASWILFHDKARDFHLQAEIGYQLIDQDDSIGRDWDDASLPLKFGLRAGWRYGLWTTRAGLGAEALGQTGVNSAMRASVAEFFEFAGKSRFPSFAGIEVDGDWARPAPYILAPTVVVDFTQIALPMKLGVATPWSPSMNSIPASWGVIIRGMFELDD